MLHISSMDKFFQNLSIEVIHCSIQPSSHLTSVQQTNIRLSILLILYQFYIVFLLISIKYNKNNNENEDGYTLRYNV